MVASKVTVSRKPLPGWELCRGQPCPSPAPSHSGDHGVWDLSSRYGVGTQDVLGAAGSPGGVPEQPGEPGRRECEQLDYAMWTPWSTPHLAASGMGHGCCPRSEGLQGFWVISATLSSGVSRGAGAH